ncbi:hypothetical protein DR92_2238 [Brucella anthropi]|nr:hypothetical protein DR92_2238 [Brucella anthropi]
MEMPTTRNNEYGFQNCGCLISTGSIRKRRLSLLSVLPPLLRKTPFADESEISSMKWQSGWGAQCAGTSFRFIGNAFQIEIICSNPIQNSRRELPEAICPIQRQTSFESKAETYSASKFFYLCFVPGEISGRDASLNERSGLLLKWGLRSRLWITFTLFLIVQICR